MQVICMMQNVAEWHVCKDFHDKIKTLNVRIKELCEKLKICPKNLVMDEV